MEFLFADWLGTPAWFWLSFLALVVALTAFDLGILHKDEHEIGARESLTLYGFYVAIALAFGGWVWWQRGSEAGLDSILAT